jgi:hypothetical protein
VRAVVTIFDGQKSRPLPLRFDLFNEMKRLLAVAGSLQDA